MASGAAQVSVRRLRRCARGCRAFPDLAHASHPCPQPLGVVDETAATTSAHDGAVSLESKDTTALPHGRPSRSPERGVVFMRPLSVYVGGPVPATMSTCVGTSPLRVEQRGMLTSPVRKMNAGGPPRVLGPYDSARPCARGQPHAPPPPPPAPPPRPLRKASVLPE